ncbi:MAG: exodeoxyribonuclease VII large subunit [Magnetospirillum sp. WYHS-4]
MTTQQPPSCDPGHNTPVFTVGELAQALKLTVEETFPFLRVRGEISGFKRAASGHLYFALKDAEAVLEAVCWKGTAQRLGVGMEDGIEVVATGRLTTYPGRSKYQMVVDSVELAGEGALLKVLEDRRRRLAAEGLFDAARKKRLPFLPGTIGVVTSPTGAVIRDILHRLADRFPRRVLVWPVLVQGDGAAAQVAAAVRGFDGLPADLRPDLVIVARGGGSLEDLWAFNEEIVVRAVADCSIPVISAVGHETDTTLIDFAADVRAPTPTAAAEMAVPVRADLMAQVQDDGQRLTVALRRRLAEFDLRLAGLERGLPRPGRLIEEAAQRLDDRTERLERALRRIVERSGEKLLRTAGRLEGPRQLIEVSQGRLAGEFRALTQAARAALRHGESRMLQAGALLDSLSYRRVLERGFALVKDGAGHPVTSAKAVRPGMNLAVTFHDGDSHAVATGRRGKPGDDRQGSLL